MAATVGTENGMQAETTSDLTGRVSNLEVSGELLNPEVSEEDKQRAEKQKEIANEYFKKQDFDLAIQHYSEAIELNPYVHTYYGNRSFAYLKTECFGFALDDASKSIQLNRSYVKSYYRRASAYMALGKFKLALKDFEAVTRAKPSDKDAKKKYDECKKIANRLAFERAIAVEDNSQSASEAIVVDKIAVSSDYDGPTFEDKIDLTFVEALMKYYKEQKVLHKKYAYKILLEILEFFKKQPSLIDINVDFSSKECNKFTICGDIHGQFYDLMNIFSLNGIPSNSNPYLFNGDFVDRGSFSVECIFTLFAFKLLYPESMFMSRGNHESTTMNQMYGFEGEVKAKYSSQMAELFTEVFNYLPLSHCINKKVIAMHGGLSEDESTTLDDIRKIDRNRQPPESGVMCDFLWSDPQPQIGFSKSKRGVGTQFGPDVTRRFLTRNNLDLVIRSHEVKNEGYEVMHDGSLITVFSAPNYCDSMGNKGAFITFTDASLKPNFTQYEAVPHPNVKPMEYANPLLSFLQ